MDDMLQAALVPDGWVGTLDKVMEKTGLWASTSCFCRADSISRLIRAPWGGSWKHISTAGGRMAIRDPGVFRSQDAEGVYRF